MSKIVTHIGRYVVYNNKQRPWIWYVALASRPQEIISRHAGAELAIETAKRYDATDRAWRDKPQHERRI